MSGNSWRALRCIKVRLVYKIQKLAYIETDNDVLPKTLYIHSQQCDEHLPSLQSSDDHVTSEHQLAKLQIYKLLLPILYLMSLLNAIILIITSAQVLTTRYTPVKQISYSYSYKY